MASFEGGSLYDANKSLIKNSQTMDAKGLRVAIEAILPNYCAQKKNHYYMLLCLERRDYTIFHCKDEKGNETLVNDFYECLFNRGKTYSIMVDDNGAVEIWIKIDSEPYCYYFFPYDNAVLES